MLRTLLLAAALLAPTAVVAQSVADTHVDVSMTGKTVKQFRPKQQASSCGPRHIHHQSGKTAGPLRLADTKCHARLAQLERAEQRN